MINYEVMSEQKQRIEWIDLAKGITILLVIVGHTVLEGFWGQIVRGIIFSFHMPLFFILSCATYRTFNTWPQFTKKLKKSAKYLLLPALATFSLDILIQYVQAINSYNLGLEFWKDKLFTLVFASGVSTSYNGFDVAGLGIAWFFFALFIGRTTFDYIQLSVKEGSKLLLFSCVISMAGVLYGKIQWMPFSMDVALASMPFFYFGHCMQYMNLTEAPLNKLGFWFVVWIGTLALTFTGSWTYMELAVRRYPLFPICYITAIAGTMAVVELSVLLCRLKKTMSGFILIGKNSMYLLCIHIMDGYMKFIWGGEEENQWILSARRIVFDLILFGAVMLIRKAICSKGKFDG